MRAISADERWALEILAGPSVTLAGDSPEGERLAETMMQLLERRCAFWQPMPDNAGTSFGITELGRLALRLPPPEATC